MARMFEYLSRSRANALRAIGIVMGALLAMTVLAALLISRGGSGEPTVEVLQAGIPQADLSLERATNAISDRVGFELVVPCEPPAGYSLAFLDSLVPPEHDADFPRAVVAYTAEGDGASLLTVAQAESAFTARPPWATANSVSGGVVFTAIPIDGGVIRPQDYYWVDGATRHWFITASGNIRPSEAEVERFAARIQGC